MSVICLKSMTLAGIIPVIKERLTVRDLLLTIGVFALIIILNMYVLPKMGAPS